MRDDRDNKLVEAAIHAAAVSVTYVANGDVIVAIVNTAAQESCDGIVLGSRGSSGWKRLMVGSISNAVAVKSPLPVLIVKPRIQI